MMNTHSDVSMAVIGLGKMGLSHFAIANATDGIEVIAVCEQAPLLAQLFRRYIKTANVSDYAAVLADERLRAVIIATPTRSHHKMALQALNRGLHVFCEKPLTLNSVDSYHLAQIAQERGLVAQVGYHNRFVATFHEAKQLIARGSLGRLRHVHAEAYGPVVLTPPSSSWRSSAKEGGGCLYDYAAHPINLMNWFVGRPASCAGAILAKQYSTEVEDAVFAELKFESDIDGQVTVNWSDDSFRKMSTKVTVWGDAGKLVVDRQELQTYLNGKETIPAGYNHGWTVRYTTDLTSQVGFYLRGEEYSAQIEAFRDAIQQARTEYSNDFVSAADTDYTLELIRDCAVAGRSPATSDARKPPVTRFFDKFVGR